MRNNEAKGNLSIVKIYQIIYRLIDYLMIIVRFFEIESKFNKRQKLKKMKTKKP